MSDEMARSRNRGRPESSPQSQPHHPPAVEHEHQVRWGSLAELETATVAYRPTWWRTHSDALEVLVNGGVPGRLGQVLARASGGVVTTQDVFSDSVAGTYLPVRAALHETIVATCLAGPGVAGPSDSAADRRPRVFFTIGAPGAGKTSILRRIVDTYLNREFDDHPDGATGTAMDATGSVARIAPRYSVIDADRVREALPEYADGLGSLVVQQEAFDITYDQVLPEAIRCGHDIVFDTIGRPSSLAGPLARLQDHGYELHILHATCPRPVCQSRTEARALVNGRLVDPTVLDFEQAIADARAVLDELVAGGRVDGWLDVDTTRPNEPQPVAGTQAWTDAFDSWRENRPPRPHLEVNP